MRSKEWTPEVEARRWAKKRRRAERRAMAKLMSRLAIPGAHGCPGHVFIGFVPDPELDRLGIRRPLPWWASFVDDKL